MFLIFVYAKIIIVILLLTIIINVILCDGLLKNDIFSIINNKNTLDCSIKNKHLEIIDWYFHSIRTPYVVIAKISESSITIDYDDNMDSLPSHIFGST